MSTTTSKKSATWWLNIVITIGLMFGVGFLEPIGGITPLGMDVLGIFLGMMYGWIFCDLVWPSLFGLVVLGLTEFNSVYAVFATLFNTTILQVLFCFMIAGLFDCFGVTDYIAGKIMSAKFIVGHPWKLASMIFLAAAIISSIVDTIPAVFLLWSIFGSAAKDVGCEKNDQFYSYMVAGIVIVSATSGFILPFKGTTLAYMGFSGGLISLDNIPVIPYIFYTTVYTVLTAAAYLALGKFALKIDVSKFEAGVDTFAELRGMKATKEQKIGLVFAVMFVGLLLWPSVFPAEWGVTKVLSNLKLIGVCILIITIGYFFRDETGKRIVNARALTKNIGWEMIFLLGATFPLADAMKSPDCGIMTAINAFVRPIVADLGPTWMVVISILLLGLITQITHNGVLAAMFMPFLIPLYTEMGGNPLVYWLLIYFILQAAFSTPAASMYSGMIFGHESFAEHVKDGYLYGAFIFVFSFIILLISMPILNVLF